MQYDVNYYAPYEIIKLIGKFAYKDTVFVECQRNAIRKRKRYNPDNKFNDEFDHLILELWRPGRPYTESTLPGLECYRPYSDNFPVLLRRASPMPRLSRLTYGRNLSSSYSCHDNVYSRGEPENP